ncbi:MAG: sulfite exporter TauE/SafE family protein [Phycisphaerales bacterium JB050]
MVGAIVGALLIGLSLGLLGSGGSILTVPILAYVIGRPDKNAIVESLAIVGGIAAVGAVQYAMAKTVAWRVLALFAPMSILGTIAGAWLASFVAGSVQLLVFGGVMMGAAVAMWKRARAVAPTEVEAPPNAHPKVLPLAIQGSVVGIMTGFVGVGGGFLIVPALVLLAKLDMRHAVGTSLALITINSASAFLSYQSHPAQLIEPIDWKTIGLFLLIGTVGSFAGRHLNSRVNQRALKSGFAVFLVIMAIVIVSRELLLLY